MLASEILCKLKRSLFLFLKFQLLYSVINILNSDSIKHNNSHHYGNSTASQYTVCYVQVGGNSGLQHQCLVWVCVCVGVCVSCVCVCVCVHVCVRVCGGYVGVRVGGGVGGVVWVVFVSVWV